MQLPNGPGAQLRPTAPPAVAQPSKVDARMLPNLNWNALSHVSCNARADESIGPEEVGDGLWNLVYYKTLLGRIDEKTWQITGAWKV